MFRHIPADVGDGQFHGAEFVLGFVAQQLQFGGAQIKERGTFCVRVLCHIASVHLRRHIFG